MVILMGGSHTIGTYDYNPAQALWYLLETGVGLPATMLDADSFSDAADALETEGLGVSLLMDNAQEVYDWIDTILSHVNAMLHYAADGRIHMRLIRNDYTAGDLPLVDEDHIIEPPTLTRNSWVATVNEIKVKYSQRVTR